VRGWIGRGVSGAGWVPMRLLAALLCCGVAPRCAAVLRAYWPPGAAAAAISGRGCCFRCLCSPARRPPASASGKERTVPSSPHYSAYGFPPIHLSQVLQRCDFKLPDVGFDLEFVSARLIGT